MKRPYCTSKNTYQRHQKTHFDYNEYRCRDCGRQFNERTGTVYNFLTHRTEVVVLTASEEGLCVYEKMGFQRCPNTYRVYNISFQ